MLEAAGGKRRRRVSSVGFQEKEGWLKAVGSCHACLMQSRHDPLEASFYFEARGGDFMGRPLNRKGLYCAWKYFLLRAECAALSTFVRSARTLLNPLKGFGISIMNEQRNADCIGINGRAGNLPVRVHPYVL